MDPLGQRVWLAVGSQGVLPPEDVDTRLVQEEAPGAPVGDRAMLLFFRCRLAVRNDLPGLEDVVAALAALGPDAAAASEKCAQLRAVSDGRPREAFAASTAAYHALDERVPALLAGWVAYDYAQDALDAGLYDDALEAAADSLVFARVNHMTEWEAETLGVIAIIRGHLGHVDQALEDNAAARALAVDSHLRDNLGLNRAYLLRMAGRDAEAGREYARLVEAESTAPSHRLMALSNLGSLAVLAGRMDEAARHLARMEALLAESPVEAMAPYPPQLRAYIRLAEGRLEEAQALHAEAARWFEERHYDAELAGHLEHWADALRRHGHPEEAFAALRDAQARRGRAEAATRRADAELAEARLAAEQRRQDYLLLQQRHAESLAELERKAAERRLAIGTAALVLAFSLALYLGNRRLRAAQRALAAKNAELDYESRHDPLTRVLNRRAFLGDLEAMLPSLPGRPALLVLVDIDLFKRINDTFGHAAGDAVLREVSARLTGLLRASDRVARWGGEEFLLLVVAPRDGEQALALVARVLASVRGTPVAVEGGALAVTVSAGFALLDAGHRGGFEATLEAVDASLYAAKRAGRNRAIGTLPGLGSREVAGPPAPTMPGADEDARGG